MKHSPALALIVVALLAAPSTARSDTCRTDRCHTYAVPDGATGGAVAAPDGNLWFAAAGYVGRLTPAGDFTRFDLPSTGSSDIAAGPGGSLYLTTPEALWRISPAGEGSRLRLGGDTYGALAAAGDLVYFANSLGGNGRIGRTSPDGMPLWTATASRFPAAMPGTMTTAAGGGAYFAESFPPRIGSVAPDGTVSEQDLGPRFGYRLGGIAFGPDGGVWFTSPEAKLIGRLDPVTRRVIAFHTRFAPSSIVAGPSRSIWFAMSDHGRWRVVRMTPAGFMTFFRVRGPIYSLAVGAGERIWMAGGDHFVRLTPFLGAHPVRGRFLRVANSHSVTLRLFCPLLDLVSCSGTAQLRYRAKVVAQGRFAQRVNDGPSTRLTLTAYGRRAVRARHRIVATLLLRQHDQGGTRRTSRYTYVVVSR